MFRVRASLAVLAVAGPAWAVAFGPWPASTVYAGCSEEAAATYVNDVVVGEVGGSCDESTPSAAPKKSTYCDSTNAQQAELPEGERATYAPRGQTTGMFQYENGRRDSYNLTQYSLESVETAVEDSDIPGVSKALVKNGGAPTYEQYDIWCEASVDGEVVRTNSRQVWVPLMTAEAVAARVNLYAQVVAALTRPQVEFVDSDVEYGWLWVRVPHHVAIEVPDTIRRSATATDPSGWSPVSSVTVWIAAEPVALTIQMPDEAGEEELGSCDLGQATGDDGCLIRFTHASVITDDDMFHGLATLEWTLSSNAGTFDGLGPITTNSGITVQVAEAMAVSRYD